jgi:hypothetical protein
MLREAIWRMEFISCITVFPVQMGPEVLPNGPSAFDLGCQGFIDGLEGFTACITPYSEFVERASPCALGADDVRVYDPLMRGWG